MVRFEQGVPVSIDGDALPLHELVGRDDRARRRVRLRPPRHGREPPRRHQEPRDLRGTGRARAHRGARRPRVDHRRSATSRARRRASSRATRSSSTTACGSRRCARRSTRSSTRRRRSSPARCGSRSSRGAATRAAARPTRVSTTTRSPPTTRPTRSATRTRPGFVRLWGLSVETVARRQGGLE